MWGSASGGVADELRLKSAPATDGENATVINLRAHGGSLDFENTKVSELAQRRKENKTASDR